MRAARLLVMAQNLLTPGCQPFCSENGGKWHNKIDYGGPEGPVEQGKCSWEPCSNCEKCVSYCEDWCEVHHIGEELWRPL